MRPAATSTALAILTLGIALARAQQPAVNSDAKAIADFKTRVNQYVDIRKKAESSSQPLKKTDDPHEIRAAQQGLVERIGAARSGAKQGDIFTPDVSTLFKRLMRPQSKVKGAKEMLKEDKPAASTVTFTINGPYPDKQPLVTSPPNLLASLPELPKDVEYRFVGKHLILRDARANTIVDYIPNAIP